jgi:hydrogenase 3 maturation protease
MGWSEKAGQAIAGAAKIVIFGIGNEMMGDDAAGSLAARDLRMLLQGCPVGESLDIYVAGTNPENFSGLVRQKQPDLVIFIDAADMGRPVGEVAFLEAKDMHSMMHSTHTMPLSFLGSYLEKITGAKVIALGIQAGQIQLEVPMSPEAAASVKLIARFFDRTLRERFGLPLQEVIRPG